MPSLLLILSIASSSADPYVAPALLPSVDGLPRAEQRADGMWLPSPLDEDVARRLRHYYEMPDQCQARIDAGRDLCATELAGALRVAGAECTLEQARARAEHERRWPVWKVVLFGAGTMALGTLVGLAAGAFQ